ncbi:MAG TPA: hypothetical protein VD794_16435, partial [Flavisolibacter sp.]|nr:hypothetical protein [Flavisolibacter sp.]
MRIYFVILSLLAFNLLGSQIRVRDYGKADSLIQVLAQATGTTRIDHLNALSEAYIWLNVDSAMLLANHALHKAQSYNYIKGVLGAYSNLAWINWHTSKNYPAMELYCRRAIQLTEQTNSKDQLPSFYFLIGLPLLAQSKYTEAIESFQKAGQLYARAGDELNQGNMYNYIAYVEHLRGHYGSSLLYSEKYLRIGQKYNDLRYMDVWGELYEVIGDYETALDYYHQAAANTRVTQKTDDLIFFTRCIGEVHFLQKKYDSALFYYNRLVDLFPAADMPKPFLGELYLALQQFEKAQQYLLYALNYFKREGGTNDVMWVLLRLSKLYKEKEDAKTATRFATELLQLAYRSGARQYIRDGHLLLYQLLVTTSQQIAFIHLQKYTTLKDTLDKDLSVQQLAFYKISAEKEKAQNRINLLNEEKKLQQQVIKQTTLQNNFLMAGIIAVGVIGLVLIWNMMLKRKNEKLRLENLLKVQKLENEKRQAELRHQA